MFVMTFYRTAFVLGCVFAIGGVRNGAVAGEFAGESVVYAGIAGGKLMDSGTLVVAGAGNFDRAEVFEYVQRPDGGHVLMNSITAKSGVDRVQGRLDYDADWNSESAAGLGLYAGTPVDIALKREGKQVRIKVRPVEAGAVSGTEAVAVCDPDCFIDLSPSITPMFVMTRHYDFAKGGAQVFRWSGQQLNLAQTLSGGTAAIAFAGEVAVSRPGGVVLKVRHFTFVETMPTPAGGTFSVSFDLWTDLAHRPIGFRTKLGGAKPYYVVGWRESFEDVRSGLGI